MTLCPYLALIPNSCFGRDPEDPCSGWPFWDSVLDIMWPRPEDPCFRWIFLGPRGAATPLHVDLPHSRLARPGLPLALSLPPPPPPSLSLSTVSLSFLSLSPLVHSWVFIRMCWFVPANVRVRVHICFLVCHAQTGSVGSPNDTLKWQTCAANCILTWAAYWLTWAAYWPGQGAV